jgi:two-component system chemotaxis sensor kinase CheA
MSLKHKIVAAVIIPIISVILFYVIALQNQSTPDSLGLACLVGAAVVTSSIIYLYKSILTPVRQASQLIGSFAVGYFENVIQAAPKDEMGDLLRAIASMQVELADKEKRYEQQVAETEMAYFKLEDQKKELDKANSRLGSLNASINTMLNALNQGLFSFGPDGKCLKIYSKSCLGFLGRPPAGLHFSEAIGFAEGKETIDRLCKLVFYDKRGLDLQNDVFPLFPNHVEDREKRKLSLSYLPILDEQNAVKSVLAIVTDKTAEETAAQLRREQEDEALFIIRLSSNRNLFTIFYNSLLRYFGSLNDILQNDYLRRRMRHEFHTFKGNAAVFNMQEVVDILHQLEDRLEGEEETNETKNKIADLVPRLYAALERVHRKACAIFGEDFDHQGSVRLLPLSTLLEFGAQIGTKGIETPLYRDYLEKIVGESIVKILRPLEMSLQELAGRYGKPITPCRHEGEDFRVYTELYEPFFASIIHLFRNIVSHAVDSPEERATRNKPEKLSVVVRTHKFRRNGRDWMSLCVEDDGRGIDIAKLRDKLRQNGRTDADNLSEDEVRNSIFASDLSTSESVSHLSGRGVGLAALKAEIDHLGGNLRVESELGAYTRFIIEAPLFWEASAMPQRAGTWDES